jgi:hypothetical protein
MPDRLAGDAARQRTRKLAAAEERAQRGGMKEATPAAPMFQRSALVSRLIITLSAWLAAFLIVFTLVALLREQLDSLPLAARLLVISGVLVVAMVNLVEPLLKGLAARLGGGDPRMRDVPGVETSLHWGAGPDWREGCPRQRAARSGRGTDRRH